MSALKSRAPLPRRVEKTLADFALDIFIPLCVMLLVGSVVYFLIDVRSAYIAGATRLLKYICFLYVMGAVLINRIRASQAYDERHIVYGVGLALAIILFMFVFSSKRGSVAGGPGPGLGTQLFFNLAIVGVIWWAADRITRECAAEDAGDQSSGSGILTAIRTRPWRKAARAKPEPGTPARPLLGTLKPSKPESEVRALPSLIAPPELVHEDEEEGEVEPGAAEKGVEKKEKTPQRLSRKHQGVSAIYFSIFALLLFGVGQIMIPQTSEAVLRNTLLCMISYVFSALALLMMTSLHGLRRYVRRRKVKVPVSIGLFWLAIGAVAILVVIVGTDFIPRPMQAGSRIVDQLELAAEGTTRSGQDKVPGLQDRYTESGRSSREVERGESAEGEETESEEGRSEGRGKEGEAPETSAISEMLQKVPGAETASKLLKYVAIAIVALFALYMAFRTVILLLRLMSRIGRNSSGMLGVLSRFFGRMASALSGLFKPRGPKTPKPKRRRIRKDEALSVRFRNPFAGVEGAKMTPAEIVRYSFDALAALAADIGCPRQDEETAFEFVHRLPPQLQSIGPQTAYVAQLYTISEYSTFEISRDHVESLREFWTNFESAVKSALK